METNPKKLAAKREYARDYYRRVLAPNKGRQLIRRLSAELEALAVEHAAMRSSLTRILEDVVRGRVKPPAALEAWGVLQQDADQTADRIIAELRAACEYCEE
jgi:CHAD domain-containing protein